MKDDKKASVKIYKPNTIMLRYTPSENNENYNACLWADFIIDMDNNRLNINSDCGNYVYQCYDSNDFLKLLTRIKTDYLLEKISTEDYVNQKQTFENISTLITNSEPDDCDLEKIKEACSHTTFNDVYIHLKTFVEDYGHEFEDIIYVDLSEYIVLDYSPKAKLIVNIFVDYIQPEIKKYLASL